MIYLTDHRYRHIACPRVNIIHKPLFGVTMFLITQAPPKQIAEISTGRFVTSTENQRGACIS